MTHVDENQEKLIALLGRIVLKQEKALETLYELTASKVYSLALKITRRHDLAEEVVADTFWQAWQEAPRFDSSKGNVIGWLMVICRSRAIDCIRKIKDHLHKELEDNWQDLLEDNNPGPVQELLELERSVELRAALLELNPLQRQLVALSFFKGLSHDEIASHMQMPLGTVKTIIRRAQATLKSKYIRDPGP